MRFITFFVFLFTSLFANSQQEKIRHYNYLSLEFLKSNYDSSLFYAKKAYVLSQKHGIKILEDSAKISILQANYLLGKTEAYSQLIEEITKQIKNDDFQAAAGFYKFRGWYETDQGQYQEALKSYDLGLQAIPSSKLKYYKGDFIHDMAVIHKRLGNLTKAIELYNQSLDLAISNNDLYLQIQSLMGKGVVYKEIKQYENAISTYENAMKLAKQSNDMVSIGDIYANIANIYTDQGYHEKSLAYNRKTKQIREKTKDIGLYYAIVLNNMGANFLELNELDSAQHYFDNASRIYNSIQDAYGIADIQISQGLLELKQGQPIRAEAKFSDGIAKARNAGIIEIVVEAYAEISETYAKIGLFEEAFEYRMKYQILSDSLYSESTKNRINELQIAFETEQKENEILRLSNENSKEREKTANSRLISFGSIGLLILISLLGLVFLNKRKQKHLLAIEQQKSDSLKKIVNAGESEKKRIGKQLHDGIANRLIKFYYDTEATHTELSHKLLEAYEDVRKISHQLDNSPRHGTIVLDRLADLIPENSQRILDIDIEPITLELKEPFGTHVYRIIQELIVNSLKHADSPKTEISIRNSQNQLSILYSDTGKGTDAFKKGNGHKNIEDRVQLMKGEIRIETSKMNGFKVKIQIPNS